MPFTLRGGGGKEDKAAPAENDGMQKQDLLLRFFNSMWFDEWIAVT